MFIQVILPTMAFDLVSILSTRRRLEETSDPPITQKRSNKSCSKRPLRRKSVTFTPETKLESPTTTEDRTIGINGTADETAVAVSTEQNSLETNELEDQKPSKRDQKLAKKKRKQQEQESASPNSPAYLEYLDQFEHDRPNWRFNKKRQVDLFKKIFDVQRVPSRYNQAVCHYISGLQGGAARTRVIESGLEALKNLAIKWTISITELKEMESLEAKRNAYHLALREQIRKNEVAGPDEYTQEEIQELEMEKARVERINDVLAIAIPDSPTLIETSTVASTDGKSEVESVQEDKKPPPPPPSTTKSKRNKRKRRTRHISSDESSSSESEEELTSVKAPKRELGKVSVKKEASSVKKIAKGKKEIFGKDFLDEFFPKPKYMY
jgi:hypothetical protein